MKDSQSLTSDQKETYEIRVQGRLDARWFDYFDDMAIIVEEDAKHQPVTVLTGLVSDQAALHGLLQKLYTLRMPLLLGQHRRS
jgi:hypothetical protein